MDKDLTLWNRAGIAALWCRDQFASFFATFWMYVIGWGIVFAAFGVLLYLDGHFSHGLAVGSSIDPLAFMIMGFAFRFFAALFLMAGERAKLKGGKNGHVWKRIGLSISLLVCLHAVGIGLEALDSKRDQAIATQNVAEIAETSNAELIGVLETRKLQIDADTDKAVAALNTEITQYITDGLNNDDLADDSRVRRNELQDAAIADKRAIDDQIMQLVASGADDRTQAVESLANSEEWAPLFVGIAQLVTLSKEPSDWVIYLCAVCFIVFWVLNAEAIVIFVPKELYGMHLADADRARRSEAAKKEHVTRKDTENEFDRDQQRKLKVQNNLSSYIPAFRKAKANKLKRAKYVPEATADYYFNCTEERLDEVLTQMVRADLISSEDADLLMDRRLPAVIDEAQRNAIDTFERPPSKPNGEDVNDIQSDA